MKKIQPQIVSEDYLFHEVSNLFTGSTKTFFSHICIDKDTNWWRGEIENTLAKYEDPAEQVHRFSECIRINIVEANSPELKFNFEPYNEILLDAIYNCDCFAIAKELLKQFNEKIKAAA